MNRFPTVLLVIGVFLAGCAGGTEAPDRLLGKWAGDPVFGDPRAERLLKDQLHVDLELMPEHQFKMNLLKTPMAGTWQHNGQQVTLSIETLGGMTFDQYDRQSPAPKPKLRTESLKEPWKLDALPDGTLKKEPASATEKTIVFHRTP